jgi:4-amino-4-deoxy-L-arabinose transferase-like glycosyltransferase
LKAHHRESEWFFLLAILIVLLALALRATDLAPRPLFIDEALHINRAHSALEGDYFAGLRVNKWLYPVILGLALHPTGPEGPWLARALSALFGAATVSVGIALGKTMFNNGVDSPENRRIGLLTGLVYAVLPMAVFHERQALVDPMMVAFTGLSILLTIRLVRKPRLWVAVLLGLTLATAFLTKLLALPYLGLPVVASLLLSRDRETLKRALTLSALSIIIAVVLIAPVYVLADATGLRIDRKVQPSLDNTLLGSLLEADTLSTLRSHLSDIGQAFGYLGVGIIVLLMLSIVWFALGESRREIGFLLIPGIGFMALPILAEQVTATGRLPSRYLLGNTLPLALLAVYGLQVLMKRASKRPLVTAPLTGALFVGAILVQSFYVDVTLLHDLRQAPLALKDQIQYSSEQSNSTRALALFLQDVWRANGGRVNALGPGDALIYLQADMGPRVGSYANSFLDRADRTIHRRAMLASWLATGEQVFFFDRDENIPDLRHLDGAQTSPAGTYGVWTLLRVEGAENPLAGEVYERLAGDPDFMADDQDALAASLTRNPPREVIVFPASHAPALAARTDLDVIPLDTRQWPLTTSTVEATLADLSLRAEGEPVDVVLVNEADTDPQRTLGLALQHSLYPTGDEEWFGLIHRQRFVTGPAEPAMVSIGAEYEGAISLTQGAIIDQQVRAVDVVRIALTWRSTVAVEDSFVVFAHLIDGAGTLWAQHDSEPGNGLLPMPSWEPGQSVDDRFAIQLPADIPSGDYEIRIGLYHPTNGLRLRVTGGQEVAPDYAVFGRISVVE